MATTARKSKRLSDEDLVHLLELAKKSDSVELKLTVPASGQRAAVAALALDPLEAQIRQVFFFDTPDLALNGAGIVVRARRVQGRNGDTVVKLRPVVPDDLPADLRKSPNLVVEVDAMPGGYVCSATLKGKAGAAAVRETAAGKHPTRKLFSKEQRAFFTDRAPAGLELDGLAVLGPIFVLKLNFTPAELGRRHVAEMWLYPGWLSDPRAVDKVHRGGCVPGRCGVARVSRVERRRPLRRAADEDEGGARVLLAGARSEGRELGPDVDAGVDRVAVDLGQLVARRSRGGRGRRRCPRAGRRSRRR